MLTIKETIQRATESGLQDKAHNAFYVHEYVELMELSRNEIELIDHAITTAYFRGFNAGKQSKKKHRK